jgi:co-chaperonin GroES (HSP10)
MQNFTTKIQKKRKKMSKQYRPHAVGPNLLVQIDDKYKTLESGIILATEDRNQAGTDQATVLEIGDLAFQPPIGDGTPWCKVGDRIVIKRYAGHNIPVKGGIQKLVADSDVIGVLEEIED